MVMQLTSKHKIEKEQKLILALIGGMTFFILNIFIPYFRLFFGFLGYSNGEKSICFASKSKTKIEGVWVSVSYNSIAKNSSNAEIVWKIIDFWQWIFLWGGILALILVLLPPLLDLHKQQGFPIKYIGQIGFAIGLLVSGIEWVLFFLVASLETWDKSPEIGWSLLILNIFGYFALFLAAKPSLILKK